MSVVELAEAMHNKHTLPINRLDLLRDEIAQHVNERALATMQRAVKCGIDSGKASFHVDLYCRQRCYIANIFLQHLDIAEPLLPFYSWDLINYRMSHAIECFPLADFEQ